MKTAIVPTAVLAALLATAFHPAAARAPGTGARVTSTPSAERALFPASPPPAAASQPANQKRSGQRIRNKEQ